MNGVNGSLLVIDLSSRSVARREIPEEMWRNYFGGSGLGAHILYHEADWRVSPLSSSNPLLIIAGLLTGTLVPTSCKVSVCSKSPLTGIWGESTAGGFWGHELKAAGFDGLYITGKSPDPVYLWIHDRQAEILPAHDIWGKDTYETSDLLRGRTDPRAQVACIGRAGENQVLISSIMFGGHDGRAAGRTGMGALMGSKNLKAIVVRGTARIPVADPGSLLESARTTASMAKQYAQSLCNFGTAGGVPSVEANGDLPIKNWSEGSWAEGARRISGQAQAEKILVDHYACWACPIRCGKIVEIRTGPHAGTRAHGPEYETCAGFGSMILNDDMHSIAAANDMCNRLGLDTISTSSVIAMATEMQERGIPLPWNATEPVLKWGSGEALIDLLEKIARRDGIGRYLADGARALAERTGGLAPEFAIHVKGLEIAYHDPRAFTSMAVNYATGTRGGCHLEGLTYFVEGGAFPGNLIGFDRHIDPHGTESKGELAARMQDLMAVYNALGICKFLLRAQVSPEMVASWVNSVMGWQMTVSDLLKTGEKLFNLKRMYNIRLGISSKDDILPQRLLVHDRKTGRAAGSLPHLGKMLADYYSFRGWTTEGIPTKQKLAELGLERLVDDVPGEPAQGRGRPCIK